MSDVRIDIVRRERDGRLHVLYSRRRADGEFGKGPDKTGMMLEQGMDAAKLRAMAYALIPFEAMVMLGVADYIEGGEIARSLDRTVLAVAAPTKTAEPVADEVTVK